MWMLNDYLDCCLIYKHSKIIIITKTPLQMQQSGCTNPNGSKIVIPNFLLSCFKPEQHRTLSVFLVLLEGKKEIQTTTIKIKIRRKNQGFIAFERNPNRNYRLILLLEYVFPQSPHQDEGWNLNKRLLLT